MIATSRRTTSYLIGLLAVFTHVACDSSKAQKSGDVQTPDGGPTSDAAAGSTAGKGGDSSDEAGSEASGSAGSGGTSMDNAGEGGAGAAAGSGGAAGTSAGSAAGKGGSSAAGSGGVAGTAAGGTGGAGTGGTGGRGAAGRGAGGRGGFAGRGAAGRGGSGGASAGRGGAGAGGNAAAGSGGAGGKSGAGGTGGTSEAGSGGTSGGRRCGTRGGVACADGEFCNFEPDPSCGDTDRGGHCEAKTEICDTLYAPVCGCDNRTYSNTCAAHREGVSVKSDGMCGPAECVAAGGYIATSNGTNPADCAEGEDSWSISGGRDSARCCIPKPPGKTCAGIANLQCSDGEFCNFEPPGGQGCDGTVADNGGVCEAVPSDCADETQPVCSCDHHSFAGICASHAAGQAKLHDGGCTQADCDAVGGHVVYGFGPPAMCAANETEYTWIVGDNGQIPIEGASCCVRK